MAIALKIFDITFDEIGREPVQGEPEEATNLREMILDFEIILKNIRGTSIIKK